MAEADNRQAFAEPHGTDGGADASAAVASQLRADLPGVAALRGVAQREDWAVFDVEFLAYMRRRETPCPFFAPAAVPELLQRIAKTDPAAQARTQAMADHALAWEFPNSTSPTILRYVPLSSDYDFRSNPTADPQFVYAMNRLAWMPELARQYRATGRREYLDFCLAFWRLYVARTGYPAPADFARAPRTGYGHLPPPWARLDTFIRLTNLWWSYWLLLTAEALAPADHTWMVAQLLRLHEAVVAHGPLGLRSNHSAMQYEAQYLTARLWPEFHGLEASALNACVALEESIRMAFFADGLHYEQSPAYGQGCLLWYGRPYLLARCNGDTWSRGYEDQLRLGFAAYDALATPDGTCPLLGDSDPDPVAPFLGLGRALFPGLAFSRDVPATADTIWFGADAVPAPARTAPRRTHLFPHAGLAVVREGGTYLTFDCGTHGEWHGHEDLLHVHYWLAGRPLLGDGGRWLYTEDALRQWVLSPAAHNTVAVAGRRLAQIEDPRHPWLEPIRLCERQGLVLLTAAHHAFTLPGSRVRCARYLALDPAAGWLLVVDELTADAPLTWQQHWLLPRPDIERQGQAVVVHDTAVLHFAGGQPVLRPQAWSPTYAVQEPGSAVEVVAQGATATLAMLLIPTGRAGTLQLSTDGWPVTVQLDGLRRIWTATDWAAAPTPPAQG